MIVKKKSSHQIRKMIFALLSYIYNSDKKFNLLSKKCLDFLVKFMIEGTELGMWTDQNQHDLTHYDTWRRALLASLGFNPSLKDEKISTQQLFEIFETIRMHCEDNDIDLNDFYIAGEIKKVDKILDKR